MNLIPTKDAAERIGVPVRTLNRWVATGKATAVLKLSGVRGANFFDPQEVERLAAELQKAAS